MNLPRKTVEQVRQEIANVGKDIEKLTLEVMETQRRIVHLTCRKDALITELYTLEAQNVQDWLNENFPV